ncbi:hypothetical protein SOVF_202320, partial [Spinacia oleracea]
TKENENYGEEELAALYHAEFPNADASDAAAIKDPKSQMKLVCFVKSRGNSTTRWGCLKILQGARTSC